MKPLLAMLIAAGALYAASRALVGTACWALVLPIALIAWPIWYAGAEYALFERRAVLAGAMFDDSRVRRWLWAGHLTRVLQAFVALFWAALLLGFAALLEPWQWGVLAADVLVLALLVAPLRRSLGREVRFEHAGLVARRWPLTFVNGLLLAVAFFAFDFFLVGAPDTRGLTWHVVFDRAWADGLAKAACPVAGALLGLLTAAERLTWHAAEVLIPSLPHPELRYAAWGAFLLQAGLLAYAFTKLVLGAVALVEQAERRDRRAGSPLAKSFWLTVALIAALYMYGVHRLQGYDVSAMREGAWRAVAWANPCRPEPGMLAAMSSGLHAELQSARAEARRNANIQIERRLDAIFLEAERGVDRYLDWYFSVLGEYQRLGSLAAGELDEMMIRALERHLFGEGMLAERLQGASTAIARESEARMAQAGLGLGAGVQARVREEPCRLGTLDLGPIADVRMDVLRVSTAAGGGALIGGVAVPLLARRVAATAATRAASRSTFRAAANLLGKQVTKRGGTMALVASAAAACAPGGPLALLCGLAGGLVSWLAIDKALIRIDEALFRDAMRADILATLAEQRAQLAEAMRLQHHAVIDQMAESLQHSFDRVFVPARHGT